MLYFNPYLGKRSNWDEQIVQMGWFNHQLVTLCQVCQVDYNLTDLRSPSESKEKFRDSLSTLR